MLSADPMKVVGVKIISFLDSTSANAEAAANQPNTTTNTTNAVGSSNISGESNGALTATSSTQNFQTAQPPATLENQSLDQAAVTSTALQTVSV